MSNTDLFREGICDGMDDAAHGMCQVGGWAEAARVAVLVLLFAVTFLIQLPFSLYLDQQYLVPALEESGNWVADACIGIITGLSSLIGL